MTRSSEQGAAGSGREPATRAEAEAGHGTEAAQAARAARAVPPGRPERAVRASGPPLTQERARNAHEASEETARAPEWEVYPGGTIETGLTSSGEPSMVASQLLWDGSTATSRVDRAIAEAMRAEADQDTDDAGADVDARTEADAKPRTEADAEPRTEAEADAGAGSAADRRARRDADRP
ncbi:hypothetical protein IMZ11_21320 [Microtetraspora sp. AC03309]|uniref:hypothetical protein n=1 Tax=Microtetraspora sp. AC03309 TaxID=2779376 RepID=UPI001E3FFEE7|nr:hypothetical protein [Microtetraspora sp. AC03309]MCC5578171.1 hypothetical protein [Microtetraspora sp. AC03309]